MKNKILVVKQDAELGTIEFNTESEVYKQLLKNPDKYHFVLGFVARDNPEDQCLLYELNMVKKK